MHLTNIRLKNFRNYEDLSIEFSAKKTLLTGKNAQGKTNLLEVIYYLSNLKSNRAGADSELVRWGEEFALMSGLLRKQDMDFELSVTLNPPKKKLLKINEIKKAKNSEFTRYLSVVNFSAEDLLLLRGVPDNRRDWLDTAISQIYPAFSDRLNKYNKIKLQKTNYLKSLKASAAYDSGLLDVYNSQLVITGSNIIFLRIKFLNEIQKYANLKHATIAPDENLVIAYESSIIGDYLATNDEILGIDAIAKAYEKKLQQEKQNEIIRAKCLVGAHRDDIGLSINGIDAKKFASQGQQRTIVLSLKLGELELIKNKLDDYPVLLLDDVLAELDNMRQNYLLSAISPDVQMIITSVDTLHFDEEYLKNVSIFKISGGKILN